MDPDSEFHTHGDSDFWFRVASYARRVLAGQSLATVHEQHLRNVRNLISADTYDIVAFEHSMLTPAAVTSDARLRELWDYYDSIDGRQRDPLFKYVLANRQPIHTGALPEGVLEKHLPEIGEWFTSHGFTHAMVAPLVRRGALVGTLHFARLGSREPFSDDDIHTARVIMGFAASATHNAVTYTRTHNERDAAFAILRRSPAAIVIHDRHRGIVWESQRAADLRACATPAARRELLALLSDGIRDRADSGDPVHRVWGTNELRTTLLPGAHGMFVTYLRDVSASDVDVGVLVPPLSRREAEVLECTARGMHNHETAMALGISVNTVKRHLKQVYRKLDVRGRTEAVRLAAGASRGRSGTHPVPASEHAAS